MSIFHFKKFSISHERSGIKVGTDAVLLGAVAPAEGVRRALDVGTGCGVMALMLLQRGVREVVAVEIDFDAAQEAKENARNSPWNAQMEVVCCDFCDKKRLLELGTFDLIVSNPPFFSHSLSSPDPKRTRARHNDALPFPILLERAERLLTEKGIFCVILPHSESSNFIALAQMNRLYLSERHEIHPKPNTSPIREILFLQRNAITPLKRHTLTIYNSENNYSAEFIALTKDFYLNL
ncbi:methyltransferase [Bacteroidales bacterium OttesenSCG-928-J16]|nr:methyltransferase [Bacteroidales bacterium OttesenSCG-928-J16]